MTAKPETLSPAVRAVIGTAFLIAGVVLMSMRTAHATEPSIPPAAIAYRLTLEHAAADRFGLNAPVARLAAQIQQESGWKPRAASAYAQGLAQFTPATARWLPGICPDVGAPDPWNPQWSVTALVCYDAWLHDKIHAHGTALAACAHWAMTLAAYNGGLGWVQRDRALASRAGHPPDTWFGSVDRVNAGRSADAWAQNRAYPRHILLTLEPAYLAAGWPGQQACP
jgi:soluble lytic murein transglycosylase-like protein